MMVLSPSSIPMGVWHTPQVDRATRDGLELYDPLGSAINNGVLYTVDVGYVRLFDLETGRPLRSIPVPESTILNGIAVADDGTVYASNTRNPEQILKVTADGDVSVFAEDAPLAAPNGVAIDQDGNIVVVNVGDNAIITYDQDGAVMRIEHSVEGGNDGIVITADGTKYVSSVRYGSVSRIRPGQEAEVIASGIPNAASMVLRLDSEPAGYSFAISSYGLDFRGVLWYDLFMSLIEIFTRFPDHESCIAHLESLRWGTDRPLELPRL